MNTVYLLLGSNEGDRTDWLNRAIEQLQDTCGPVTKRSAIYETAAWGIEDQPSFLNMALCIDTELQPLALLKQINTIEANLGRQRTLKWGQRTLDIDILFFNNDIIDLPELKVPHPEIQNRRFALVPMHEIAAELIHPANHKTITELLKECKDTLEAVLYTPE